MDQRNITNILLVTSIVIGLCFSLLLFYLVTVKEIHLSRTITINKPIEAVWDFFSDSVLDSHRKELWPHIYDIGSQCLGCTVSSNSGYYTTFRIDNLVPQQKISFSDSYKWSPSTYGEIIFIPKDDKTTITWTMDYYFSWISPLKLYIRHYFNKFIDELEENLNEGSVEALYKVTPKLIGTDIMIPENMDRYLEIISKNYELGLKIRAEDFNFVKKKVGWNRPLGGENPYSYTISVEATIKESGFDLSPYNVSIRSLSINDATAYVVLSIDIYNYNRVISGSLNQVIIHPIIEQTLLLQSNIDKVLFEYAPHLDKYGIPKKDNF